MRSFSGLHQFDYQKQLIGKITSEVESESKEYILTINETEYLNHLINKYELIPLRIHFDAEIRHTPVKGKGWVESRLHGEKYEVDCYSFTISFPYTGSSELFEIQPSHRAVTSYEIDIKRYNSTVSLSFEIYKQDVEEFNRERKSAIDSAFANVNYVNTFVRSWNDELPNLIKELFLKRRSHLQHENDFFAAINIPIDPDTKTIFTPSTIRKKDIPQPKISQRKEYSSEPNMAKSMYEDILKIIYEAGRSMERKPSLYVGKDEESLRDQFLFILETRYYAVTATGETFNRSGKTDIILKYAEDGSNLFVAECKFWTGAAGFIETINQLFERYLTWRDSKVAVMMFVKNKDFTSVLLNIANTSRTHPYFVRDNGKRGESSFSYLFRLPQDSNKHVYLEIMAFHYDKE
ncbi:MAG: hypothetical protein EOO43_02125 [Flavobacterium sp.]|nr:MAG: hypothetical protein EOO43_02125 [Flavobacterium sp.]